MSRPSAAARGYDSQHNRLRAQLDPVVQTGTVRCSRGAACKFAEGDLGGFIAPGSPWDLGHDDRDRSRYTGPEHAACNRATVGRGGTRKRPPEAHPGLI